MKGLIERSKGPYDILLGLKKRGITHMLIYYPLFERWIKDNFSDEKLLLIERFFLEHVVLLFKKKGVGISVLEDSL